MLPCPPAGTVSGVQASIQSFFEILSFVAGLIAHQPQDFWVLMLGSCGSVAAAAGLYIAFVCNLHFLPGRD
jgi:1,4-dihydroxy-2-naphthoate octaprenyltransferase